jgi:hypothetical protein
VAKHGVVIDVEDRILDEIKELGFLKNEFMKLLSNCADEKRGVLYSELLYDEALQLLVKMTEDFSTQLQVGKVQDTTAGSTTLGLWLRLKTASCLCSVASSSTLRSLGVCLALARFTNTCC